MYLMYHEISSASFPVLFVARIQYCSQEIVVFREDIIMKMCRNSIKFPDSRTEIPKNVSSF